MKIVIIISFIEAFQFLKKLKNNFQLSKQKNFRLLLRWLNDPDVDAVTRLSQKIKSKLI